MDDELRKATDRPIAMTLGEPAGIGPDIAIKAWLSRNELNLPAFYLLGDCDFLSARAKALGVNLKLADIRANEAAATFAQALPPHWP
jgi:4-hydroxythreonine-4-phosphate dehydrogenase